MSLVIDASTAFALNAAAVGKFTPASDKQLSYAADLSRKLGKGYVRSELELMDRSQIRKFLDEWIPEWAAAKATS